MRAVFALVLVVGMALAGVAVYLAQSYVGQSQAEVARAKALQQKTGKLVQVYAINKSMKFGDPLTKDDVEVIYVQEKFLPAGAYVVPKEDQVIEYKPAEVSKKKDAIVIVTLTGPLFPENVDKPRYIMRSMEPHEIVLASRVTEPGQVAGLTGKLERGMRAFQIKVSSSSGVADFVMPESFIDIYWTGVSSGNINGEITQLIESTIRVIAVDQASVEGQSMSGTASTVTVAATPEQVARLARLERPAGCRCRLWPMAPSRWPVRSRWMATSFSGSRSRKSWPSKPRRPARSRRARATRPSKRRSPAPTEIKGLRARTTSSGVRARNGSPIVAGCCMLST
ncbi:hypothetical protein MASR1M32_17320 [Rhodobacter sp.]